MFGGFNSCVRTWILACANCLLHFINRCENCYTGSNSPKLLLFSFYLNFCVLYCIILSVWEFYLYIAFWLSSWPVCVPIKLRVLLFLYYYWWAERVVFVIIIVGPEEQYLLFLCYYYHWVRKAVFIIFILLL